MIRVLVVEDETPILRSICYMIEKTCNRFKIIDTANNGKKAIKFLEEKEYDVLFLDINMPVLNGIKVMEYISENKINIITVILSGYREFEYAKKAIEYGAFNYLLKPLDRKILAETLIDIENEILKNERQKKLFNIDIKKYKDFNLASNEPCYITMLCFGSIRFGNDINEDVETEKMQSLKICEDYLYKNMDSSDFIFLEHNDLDTAFILYRCRMEAIKSISENLLKQHAGADMPLYIYVYNKLITMDTAVVIKDELKKKIKNIISFNCEKVFVLNDIEEKSNENKQFLQEFILEIKNVNECTSFNKIKLICENYMLNKCVTKLLLMDEMRRLLRKLCERKKCDYFKVENELFALLDNSFEHNKIINMYLSFIVNRFFDDEYNADKDLLAFKIHEYIDLNYSEQISLNSIAHHFGFVSNHVRRIFKSKYNLSPNDYITQVRIENAKRIMLDDISAKDAAKAVGYMDSLYFYKVFKKYTGFTVSEYKSNNSSLI